MPRPQIDQSANVHSGASAPPAAIRVPARLALRTAFASNNQTSRAALALLCRGVGIPAVPTAWRPKLDDVQVRLSMSDTLSAELAAIAAASDLTIEAVAAWIIERERMAQAGRDEAAANDASVKAQEVEQVQQRIALEATRILSSIATQPLKRRLHERRFYVEFAASSAGHALVEALPGAKRASNPRERNVSEKYAAQLDATLGNVQELLRSEFADRQAELNIRPLPLTPRVRVDLAEDRLHMRFDYNAEAVAIIGRLKCAPAWAQYDVNRKNWSVSWNGREALRQILPALNEALAR